MENITIVVTESVEEISISVSESVPQIEVEVNQAVAGLSAYQVAVFNGFTGTEVQWLNSLKAIVNISNGPKKSGIDPGEIKDLAVDDDYLYICVKAGNALTAIWKKTLLFQT